MIRLQYKIIISLIIAVLFFNLSANALFSAAHTVEESGVSSPHKLNIFGVASNDHCPACPDRDHQGTDHTHSTCEHHSSLYFGCQSLLISYHPTITMCNTSEILNAFPEVFPEKFIPPKISPNMLG